MRQIGSFMSQKIARISHFRVRIASPEVVNFQSPFVGQLAQARQ
jgi:hypothetical protein